MAVLPAVRETAINKETSSPKAEATKRKIQLDFAGGQRASEQLGCHEGGFSKRYAS